MTKMYVSDEDRVVLGKGSVTALFRAGVPRPLRESLVHAALAAGVKEVATPQPKAAPKARESSSKGTS